MSATLRHECVRVPVTALAFCGRYLLAAEGPFLRIFDHDSSIVLLTKQIFNSQVIHGILVQATLSSDVVIVIWGGCSLRLALLRLSTASPPLEIEENHPRIWLSQITKAPDWVLDLSFGPLKFQRPKAGVQHCNAAAITAHNALLDLDITYYDGSQQGHIDGDGDWLKISVSELTASSRCILYSAHLFWLSLDRILIAAGTAFGEILVWSWIQNQASSTTTQLHYVFTGHEGSIFGIRISEELPVSDPAGPRRLLASCSDDRSIRIWDISDLPTTDTSKTPQEGADALHVRETGFGANTSEIEGSSKHCLAIGWGHLSRVWTLQFLGSNSYPNYKNQSVQLISTGEDATSRLWEFIPTEMEVRSTNLQAYSFILRQVHATAYHCGKNVWSLAVLDSQDGRKEIVTGAADSKLITYYLPSNCSQTCLDDEWTLEEALHSPELRIASQRAVTKIYDLRISSNARAKKTSKSADIFRSYAFADDISFIATTNNGMILISDLKSLSTDPKPQRALSWAVLDQLDELKGYSTTASINSLGLVFIAGSSGSIYMYSRSTGSTSRLYRINGKVAGLFPEFHFSNTENGTLSLLVTMVGARTAQLLFGNHSDSSQPCITECVAIPLSELIPGFIITSKILVDTSTEFRYLFLGSRNGSIAMYAIRKAQVTKDSECPLQVSLVKIINEVHGRETVTSMFWILLSTSALVETGSGYLLSTGRDGFWAVHYVNTIQTTSKLVHKTALPFGPNIEGVYINEGGIMIYGFRSKQFVLFNESTEEEILAIECGGAHRNWAFNHHQSNLANVGGTLVWTQASNVKVCSYTQASHRVLRDGGHGREIKAVAVSPFLPTQSEQMQLIATGAEDTDIKIFEYINTESSSQDLRCVRTLRKHTTGIQHLQWSEDGSYLFSSGGCEEFYVWRVRSLPVIGVCAVCEAVCLPQSEIPDLRIMSFTARRIYENGNSYFGFMICMAYSDSTIRIYTYTPHSQFHLSYTGTYLTSCFTQCALLSSTLLTSGTDGHIALWHLPSPPSASDSENATPEQLTYYTRTKLHQNTVKTLATHSLSQDTALLVTGGDDGALGLTLLRSFATTGLSISTLLIPRAHASAVTACAVLPSDPFPSPSPSAPPSLRPELREAGFSVRIVTSGNDQRVTVWAIQVDVHKSGVEGIEVAREGTVTTAVADVADMAVLEGGRVLVCGVGMEVWKCWGLKRDQVITEA